MRISDIRKSFNACILLEYQASYCSMLIFYADMRYQNIVNELLLIMLRLSLIYIGYMYESGSNFN
jgi:hypothetical protein